MQKRNMDVGLGTSKSSSYRLLIVDDDLHIRNLLKAVLRNVAEVAVAGSGEEALGQIERRRPDLVLLDAVMPAMDGYAVCAALRSVPENRDIPIIFVTGLDSPEDETRALQAGAVDFIHKPINAAVVQARVQTHLMLKSQRDNLQAAGAALQKANEALLRSNQDLQNFAFLAAHDLKAPLNSISGFTRLLKDECGSALSDQARKYTGHVLDSAHRMQDLIRGLLAYALLESQARPFEKVNLAKVFDQVHGMLDAGLREAHAEVSCGDLPDVNGDPRQIVQLLMNLVENGIKYNRAASPQVRVSAMLNRDGWVFAITDNGIGIAPRYHRQIFELFRRLHGADAFQGSGIGLAICQRIVEHHGGRIWVESREGQGSTFYFTLPGS